jgi:hypothetical protein
MSGGATHRTHSISPTIRPGNRSQSPTSRHSASSFEGASFTGMAATPVSISVADSADGEVRRMSLTSFGADGELQPTLSMMSAAGGNDSYIDVDGSYVDGSSSTLDVERPYVGMVNFGSPTPSLYDQVDADGGQTPFNPRNSTMMPPPPSSTPPVAPPTGMLASPPSGPPPMVPPPPGPPPMLSGMIPQPPPGPPPMPSSPAGDFAIREITTTPGKAAPADEDEETWM